jgi:riboflavin synthase
MFTGLIRRIAPVTDVRPTAAGASLAVDRGEIAAGIDRGDSVCISGVCLTVTERDGAAARFDVVRETLSRTTLGELRRGDAVNVEPSLRVGDPLGGHFVLGHVDGVGRVAAVTPAGEGREMRVSAGPDLLAQMVSKGSVAVDGVSLTLVDVADDSFSVALIPTTLSETTLGRRRAGDSVNLETDILGKLVARALGSPACSGGLTLDKLRQAGFADR